MINLTPHRSSIVYAATLMLAAFYFLPISRLELDLYDEAIRLYAAEQIVAGQKPYQDFYAIYGPGEFLPIALGFVCFGKEILIARLIMVASNAVAAMALFALLRHFQLSRAVCLSGLILWLIPRHASGLVLYACSPALTLLLLAALVFARSKTLTLGKIAWIAGGLVGLATICRHDFGCYGFIAGLVAIIGYPAGAECPISDGVITFRQRLFHCLRFSIAWGLVAIPVYAYFAWPNPERLFACLVQYPAATVAYRNLPFPWHEVPHRLTSLSLLTKPSPGNVRTVLSELSPLAIVLFTGAAPLLATLLMTKRTRASLAQCKAWRSCLPFLIACSCGIACYGMMRSSLHHLFPMYTLMLPASLKLLQANFGRSSASVWQPRFMRAGTIGLALTAAAIGGGRWRDAFTRPLVDLPHASGIVSLELKQVDALTTITDTIAAQDPAKTIFVGTNRHDRVHSNPLLIYFLSDTTSGTYFHHFDPGITTELQYQQRIIDDLNASKTLLIVLWRTELPNEPNLSQQSSGVMLLDDFLREKYRTISSTSLFEIRGR